MLYEATVPQFIKTLNNMTAILNKAAGQADQKKYEVDVLLNARLAPDQFNLIRQIQIACDTAKNGVARLTGKDSPVFEDTEKTFADVQKRIEKVVSYLKTVNPKDFAGAEERHCTTPRWEGKWLTGMEFFTQSVVPNFYFHVTTAYSILRHNGIEIGKRDYLGELPFKN